MLVILTLIFSFCLDGIISNFIPIHSSLVIPLFTLVSLIIVYPYFKRRENDYLKVAAILGLFYDIVYTDTIFFQCILFLIIAFCVRFLNEWVSNNVFSISLMAIVLIACYRALEYSILSLVGFFTFDSMYLLQGIYSSLLLNVIYAIILYLITDWLSKKYHILKVD